MDIEILDVNDHAPVFNKLVYETTIHESTPQGKGPNRTPIYKIYFIPTGPTSHPVSHGVLPSGEELVTVLASDDDQDGTANSLLSFRVVSVTPNVFYSS